MNNRLKSKLIILSGIVLLVFVLSRCDSWFGNPDTEGQQSVYLNLSDTVGYVGIETCRQCHFKIYETFVHTGMGSSFGQADTTKSIAKISQGEVIYDPHLNMYYHPYWQDTSLLLKEFRLDADNGDTLFSRREHIDYVVGSGQHTNSHIIDVNGYLQQAPFTWYSQEGKLDLPPGYENGGNVRFDRKIGLECTSCHNSMPIGFIKGSENKYNKVPGAIDCERCHGPGELHVKRMQAGLMVDTARETDYSIVNVGKLSAELQFEVCQRCHLQGNSVLHEGKSFFDFRPGMKLNEVMDIYLPRYSNSGDNFIMASHIDRFQQSKCVINSKDEFNCISCHNPHVSVLTTRINKFNSSCGNCHKGGRHMGCTEKAATLEESGYNCVNCHMPKSTSTDIPHVTVHDHKIKIPGKVVDTSGIGRFLELVAINNDQPSDRSKAMAYLQQFERFTSNPIFLDSAEYFLERLNNQDDPWKLWVQYYFLAGDYDGIVKLVNSRGTENVLGQLNEVSYSNSDGWTAYRIGEGMRFTGNVTLANRFMEKAVELMPYNPDFRNKEAGVLAALDQFEDARNAYEKTLSEFPDHKEALNNLGFLYLQQRETAIAQSYFKKALKLDPDYELAWLNLANVRLLMGDNPGAKHALLEALRINPENSRAMMALEQLNSKS